MLSGRIDQSRAWCTRFHWAVTSNASRNVETQNGVYHILYKLTFLIHVQCMCFYIQANLSHNKPTSYVNLDKHLTVPASYYSKWMF